MYILPQYHASLIQPVKYKEATFFAVFVHVLSKLSAPSLKAVTMFLYLFRSNLLVSVRYELWVNVPITIFFPMVDCTRFVLSFQPFHLSLKWPRGLRRGAYIQGMLLITGVKINKLLTSRSIKRYFPLTSFIKFVMFIAICAIQNWTIIKQTQTL